MSGWEGASLTLNDKEEKLLEGEGSGGNGESKERNEGREPWFRETPSGRQGLPPPSKREARGERKAGTARGAVGRVAGARVAYELAPTTAMPGISRFAGGWASRLTAFVLTLQKVNELVWVFVQ